MKHMQAISTEALRQSLQQRYLKSITNSELHADSAFVDHNSKERGHKLLNLVYVLNYIKKDESGGVERAVPLSDSTVSGTHSVPKADGLRIGALLGHKARGFGQGLWNGFGGKVDVGEDKSITASAARELEEESGIKLIPIAGRDIGSVCRHVGILFYQYPIEKQALTFEVHVYAVDGSDVETVVGEPVESEEMTPIRWFAAEDIPLEQMWADDPFWLPQLMSVLTNVNHPSAVEPLREGLTSPIPCTSHISSNIDTAAFVGYVDFSTMSEVRGSTVLFGKSAVNDLAEHILKDFQRGADASEEHDNPLRHFKNLRCPIY